MQGSRALVVAESDSQDLPQPTLDRSMEIRVRLHPIDQQHAVRLRRQRVVVHGRTVRQVAQDNRLHRRVDRAADRLRSHAQPSQHLPLTFGSRPTVRSHRRYHERLRASRAQPIDGRPDDGH